VTQNLFVCDYYNHRIRLIDVVTRRVSTLAGTGKEGHTDGKGDSSSFKFPCGIEFDGRSKLWVWFFCKSVLRCRLPLESLQQQQQPCARPPPLRSEILSSARMCPIRSYVTDSGHCTIRMIDLAFTPVVVTTIAGKPGKRGLEDGPGEASQFDWPVAMLCAPRARGRALSPPSLLRGAGTRILGDLPCSASVALCFSARGCTQKKGLL